jgi:hypothetical protein
MTGEEVAALAIALRIARGRDRAPEPVARSAWKLSARRPEIEFDDLRSLTGSDTCSPRF